MNAIKRLCTYFCSGENEEVNFRKKLQDLPLEMLIHIFEFLPPSQCVILRNECKAFQAAISMSIRYVLGDIRVQIRSQVFRAHTKLQNILQGEKMFCQTEFIKTYMGWRILQMDVSLLYVMVWRYSDDLQIWSSLTPLIAPIIEEVDEEMRALSRQEWKSSKIKLNHPLLQNFIEKFPDEIEVHFYNSEKWASFELKLIDTLLCCPSGNLKMIYTKSKQTNETNKCYKSKQAYARIEMFFELMNTKEKVKCPNIKTEATRYQNEKEILRFMRNYTRKANLSFLNSVFKAIDKLRTGSDTYGYTQAVSELLECTFLGDETSVRIEKKYLSQDKYQEIYERAPSMNLGRCGIISTFETINDLSNPVFFNNNCTSKNSEMNGRCYACLIPSINNAFTLSIVTDYNKSDSMKEILVVYDPEKDNYSMSAFKHVL